MSDVRGNTEPKPVEDAEIGVTKWSLLAPIDLHRA